ncbi:hypothetical protein KZ813_06030 [Sphingomonas sp. RHCKR7]|uniref:hypothetical protein n=1 Tax=Sphingomonas folli TaxID=2862497 RepID=UPI001CA49AD2|nr:hypothetical protein [Sphingomonas folli]MBW6526393.1 hypothetical protein [Sphingomonas folli]
MSRLTMGAVATLPFVVAMPACAESGPFGVAPVAAVELHDARGGYSLTRGEVRQMVRDQLAAYDRQTGQIAVVTFDNWSFDVGLPLIAANIGR